MIINRVTVTGADDGTPTRLMLELQDQYPQLEYGLLLSKSNQSKPEYPSLKKVKEFQSHKELQLSGHLCGSWVKEMLQGRNPVKEDLGDMLWKFGRVQINVINYLDSEEIPGTKQQKMENFLKVLEKDFVSSEVILQRNSSTQELLEFIRAHSTFPFQVLCDGSWGTGKQPERWPGLFDGVQNGYAGGLGGDDCSQQLEKIEKAVGDAAIWVDAQGKLRIGGSFDLVKVGNFAKVASKYFE